MPVFKSSEEKKSPKGNKSRFNLTLKKVATDSPSVDGAKPKAKSFKKISSLIPKRWKSRRGSVVTPKQNPQLPPNSSEEALGSLLLSSTSNSSFSSASSPSPSLSNTQVAAANTTSSVASTPPLPMQRALRPNIGPIRMQPNHPAPHQHYVYYPPQGNVDPNFYMRLPSRPSLRGSRPMMIQRGPNQPYHGQRMIIRGPFPPQYGRPVRPPCQYLHQQQSYGPPARLIRGPPPPHLLNRAVSSSQLHHVKNTERVKSSPGLRFSTASAVTRSSDECIDSNSTGVVRVSAKKKCKKTVVSPAPIEVPWFRWFSR